MICWSSGYTAVVFGRQALLCNARDACPSSRVVGMTRTAEVEGRAARARPSPGRRARVHTR